MTQKPTTSLFRIIWHVIKPYRWYVTGFMLLVAILASDWAIYSYLLKWLLDAMQQSLITKQPVSLMPALFLVAEIIISFSLYRVWDWFKLVLRPAIETDSAMLLLRHLMRQPHSFYQDHFAGALANKVNDVATGIPDLLDLLAERFFYTTSVIAISLGMLWYILPQIALLMSCWVVIFVAISLAAIRTIHLLSEAAAEERSGLTGQITDVAANMLSVRLFNGKAHETALFTSLWSSWKSAVQRRDWTLIKLYTLLGSTWVIRELISITIIMTGFNRGTITLGDATLVFTLGNGIGMNLWNLMQESTKAMKLVGEISQGLKTIMVEPTIVDHPDACNTELRHGNIAVENVSFHYPSGAQLFKNLSLAIPAGQKVGIVGYSGSGKTTLVNLMLRLFDIQGGAISIDGQDIRSMTQAHLRSAIAFIPQEPGLFHRSLHDNIQYGDFEAPKDAIIRAATKAHAAEFISELSNGYETIVGDRGVKLSGGQRQRIALARAFLRKTPILIMDEATSALDSETERYIQQSLERLMAQRTTIVIAHRLSTLLTMDRIIVMDKGTIVEDGSHAELLAQRGKYYELWSAQSNGFIPEVPQDQ